MDYNLLLQFADKYDVDYTLEQAVLASSWESFLEALEGMVEEFQNMEMDYYDKIPIQSGWQHFWDPIIPDEVFDVLDDEEAYSYLSDFLSLDYQDLFREIDSGDFWNYQDIEPDIRELLKEQFVKVEFDNYNRFAAHINMPYVSEIMDEDLIDLLDPHGFYSEAENIEKAMELINKIHAHKSNIAVDILKDIENRGYKNLEDVNGSKDNLLQYVIKHIIDNMEKLRMLSEQLQYVFKLNEKTYKALDAAVDCIADHLKGIEKTYSDPFYWLDYFEANGMAAEAKKMKKMLAKRQTAC